MRQALLFLLLCINCLSTPAAIPDGAQTFKQLTALVGDWEGKFEDGRVHRVTYRLTAGDSVLVETWALAPGRESMTLYHLDGDELVAVHYCPQQTQPRLKLSESETAGTLAFTLDGGSSLDVPGRSHQHAFWVRLDDPDHYTRSETYVDNDSGAEEIVATEPGAPIVYTRVAGPAATQ
jgi:hypothetical protein